MKPIPPYFGRHWSWSKEWKYWREWTAVKNLLMNGRETWTKDEETRRRHEFQSKAIGREKSHYDLTNPEFDDFLKDCWAITQPGNLNAQLRQLRMKRKRVNYRLWELMRELGIGLAYVQAIVHQMNENGQLASNDIDNLDADDLKKVVIALRKHKQRGGGTVREYVLHRS